MLFCVVYFAYSCCFILFFLYYIWFYVVCKDLFAQIIFLPANRACSTKKPAGNVFRDDNKFIFAEAAHEIVEQNDLPKKFCEVKDHNVSHLMAQGAVYLFQIIQEFLFFYFRSFFSRYRKNPTFRIIPTIVEIGAARPILVRLALGWILMK